MTLRSLRQIRWRINGLFDGGLQFTVRTWRSNVGRISAVKLTYTQRRHRREGRYSYAYGAPAPVQILASEELRHRLPNGNPQNSMGWPNCGAWFW